MAVMPGQVGPYQMVGDQAGFALVTAGVAQNLLEHVLQVLISNQHGGLHCVRKTPDTG